MSNVTAEQKAYLRENDFPLLELAMQMPVHPACKAAVKRMLSESKARRAALGEGADGAGEWRALLQEAAVHIKERDRKISELEEALDMKVAEIAMLRQRLDELNDLGEVDIKLDSGDSGGK